MKLRQVTWMLLLLVSLAVLVFGTAAGAEQPAPMQNETTLRPGQTGNYCIGCHTPGDPRLLTVADWRGSIEREANSPCPAASAVHEELYYTERLFLAVDRLRAGLPAGMDLEAADKRLAAANENYARLLDAPVSSLSAYQSEAQMLRYRLGKVYTQLLQAEEGVKRQRVLFVAVVVTLAVLGSLAWGMYNTRQAQRHPQKTPSGWKTYAARFLVLLLIFGLFALPLFRAAPQVIEEATEEELERQATLDEAGRAADEAERSQGQTWMLAKVGAAWQASNPEAAVAALDEALRAAEEARLDEPALWGEAHSAVEVSAAIPVELEKADLVAGRLSLARGRAWGLRHAAVEWQNLDEAEAAEILEQALRAIPSVDGLARDLDLRQLAVAWGEQDPVKAKNLLSLVHDPAIRAWGFRELASASGESSYYDLALEAARKIADPVQQARGLREIGSASGRADLFQESLSILENKVEGAALAYALSDLAAAWGELRAVQSIPSEWPEAAAAAYYRMGLYEEAWQATKDIADPYERARAQSAVAAAWGSVEAAREIEVSLLRDRALASITANTGDVSLAGELELPYYQVRVLAAAGDYAAAWDAAADLKDTYPLRALAVAWAAEDPQAALEVIEAMDREADKAAGLRAVALALPEDEALFERALGMALAARIRGDALAPVQASLDLATGLAQVAASDKAEAAFEQAYQAAQRIIIR